MNTVHAILSLLTVMPALAVLYPSRFPPVPHRHPSFCLPTFRLPKPGRTVYDAEFRLKSIPRNNTTLLTGGWLVIIIPIAV